MKRVMMMLGITIIMAICLTACSPDAQSSAAKYNLPDVLVPSGARILEKEPGNVSLICNQSFNELLAFYKDVLNTLSAKEESSEILAGMWSYTGTYDNGKSIEISITGGSVDVEYDV